VTEHFSKEVITLVLAAFTGTAAFRLSVPAVAYYSRSILEATALGIGLITSAFFTGRALMAIGTGGLADKLRKKMAYLATVAFIINALTTYTYVYASSIYVVALIRFIQGSLNGLGWVSLQYILGGLVNRKFRGRTYSIYFISGSLGGIAGNYIYSEISGFTLGKILLVSSAFFIITSFLTLSVGVSRRELSFDSLHTKKPNNLTAPSNLKTAYIAPIFLILFVLGLSSAGLKGDLIYIYFKEWFGLSKSNTASLIATAGLIALVGNYLISWFADSVNDYFALVLSTSLAALGLILVGLTSLIVAVSGLILFSVGASATLTLSRKAAVTFFSKGGFVIGLANAAGNLGSIAGGLIIGYLYDFIKVSYTISSFIHFVGFQAVVGSSSALTLLITIPFIKKVLLGVHSK